MREEVEQAKKNFEEEQKEEKMLMKQNIESYIEHHKDEQLQEKRWREEIASFET